MNYDDVVLTPEEQAYEKEFRSWNYKTVDNFEEVKKQLQEWVRASRERKRISLRIPQGDLQRIKLKAQELGMPYQTLINSVLHQYATWAIG